MVNAGIMNEVYIMRIQFLYTFLVALLLFGSTSVTSAQRKRALIVSPTRQMEVLLPKVEKKIENLNAEVDRIAGRGSVSAATTDSLSESLSKLDEDIAGLRGSIESGYPVNDEVRAVLVSSTRVDQFLLKNRVSASTSTQWRSLKRDLVSLAAYNRISWNWRQSVPPLQMNTTAIAMPSPTPTPSPTQAPTPYPTATPYSSGSLYTVSESQMSTLLSRIDLKSGIFRTQLQAALNGDTTAGRDDVVLGYLSRFEAATTRLRQQFGRRDATLLDVTDVLTAATYLDQYIARNRTTSEASGQWRDLRNDLNTLSTYYRQSWNWNQDLPTGPLAGGTDLRGFASRITGTYRLNVSASDDLAPIVNRALNSVNIGDRENTRLSLERRLRPPEMLAIEMNNRTVSMASSLLPKVTFQADGTARSEANERGRTVTTTATVDEDGLMVTYLGQRSNDFYLTIVPSRAGRLSVTRRVFLDESSEGISVTSVYEKIDNAARWTGLSMRTGDVTATEGVRDTFVVPAGTRLNLQLRSAISSSPATDRVSMEVTSPGQYRRALVNGRVLLEDPRTRVAGRSRALIAFDTITMPDGNTYPFAGDILSITSSEGEVIEVTNQTANTSTAPAQQRGVGGILGALIGAISGVPADQGTSTTQAGAIISQRGERISLGIGSEVTVSARSTRP